MVICNSNCYESTLSQNTADGYTLDNNWIIALSLMPEDSTRVNNQREILSSVVGGDSDILISNFPLTEVMLTSVWYMGLEENLHLYCCRMFQEKYQTILLL